MHILMPFQTKALALRMCAEILERQGIRCSLTACESAEKLRRLVQNGSFDLLITSESAVLPRRHPLSVPTVYLGTEFYCADTHIPSGCAAYWIAQEELAFDFMTHGARDKRLQVCGVPLGEGFRRRQTRGGACRALGITEDTPIYSFWTDGVSRIEIQSSVRACRSLCPQTKLLLWNTNEAKRGMLRTTFAGVDSVYVPDTEESFSLCTAACDVFFAPACPPVVCGAARQGKNIILLHSVSPRERRNAAFLDAHGIAFRGQTAADNVSYACRLLSLTRLQQNMHDAQERFIIRDAEQRLLTFVRNIQQ